MSFRQTVGGILAAILLLFGLLILTGEEPSPVEVRDLGNEEAVKAIQFLFAIDGTLNRK